MAGDRTECKIASTHAILTTKWDSTQQLKALGTRSTHTLKQTGWVEPPNTGLVGDLERRRATSGNDITGLVALSRRAVPLTNHLTGL